MFSQEELLCDRGGTLEGTWLCVTHAGERTEENKKEGAVERNPYMQTHDSVEELEETE